MTRYQKNLQPANKNDWKKHNWKWVSGFQNCCCTLSNLNFASWTIMSKAAIRGMANLTFMAMWMIMKNWTLRAGVQDTDWIKHVQYRGTAPVWVESHASSRTSTLLLLQNCHRRVVSFAFQKEPSNCYKLSLYILVHFFTSRTKLLRKVCLYWVSPLPQKRRKETWIQFFISTTSRRSFIASEQRITIQHTGMGIDFHISQWAYVGIFPSFTSECLCNRWNKQLSEFWLSWIACDWPDWH